MSRVPKYKKRTNAMLDIIGEMETIFNRFGVASQDDVMIKLNSDIVFLRAIEMCLVHISELGKRVCIHLQQKKDNLPIENRVRKLCNKIRNSRNLLVHMYETFSTVEVFKVVIIIGFQLKESLLEYKKSWKQSKMNKRS